MRKYLILLCAVSALFACAKIEPEVETPEVSGIPVGDIVFDFTVKYPAGTKATKQDWENGDAVFVFFQNIGDFYLKMSYNGTNWSTALAAPGGTLPGTINTEGKTVTAIYRPFGSSESPTFNGVKGWTFPTTQYTYYMACEKVSHTLAKVGDKWVISAMLNMVNPNNYVQFWVEDAQASDGAYNLSTDAVIPTGFASVASDGSVAETTGKSAGNAMLGYKYNGGYLFSGKLNTSYSGTGYYFIKNNASNSERRDYLITGKTLSSHSAVKLPANGNSKWLQVGPSKYVELKGAYNTNLGSWRTCNYGASLPEQIGTTLDFDNAVAQHAASEGQFQDLINYCTWAWTSVNGQVGMGVKAATGFLFLPAQYETSGDYWTSSTAFDVEGVFLSFDKSGNRDLLFNDRTIKYAVRPIL